MKYSTSVHILYKVFFGHRRGRKQFKELATQNDQTLFNFFIKTALHVCVLRFHFVYIYIYVCVKLPILFCWYSSLLCVAAMMGMFGWLFWCFANRKKHYVRYCALSVLGVHLSLLLEVLDFPPLFWTLDAHALWHACTAPLNLLWWKWVVMVTCLKEKIIFFPCFLVQHMCNYLSWTVVLIKLEYFVRE